MELKLKEKNVIEKPVNGEIKRTTTKTYMFKEEDEVEVTLKLKGTEQQLAGYGDELEVDIQ